MRFEVNALPKRSVTIGRTGENKYTVVEFDVSAWLTEYAGAEIAVIYRRPDDVVYPVRTQMSDNAIVSWSITDTDVAVAGYGEVELRVMLGEMIGTSGRMSVKVKPSLKAGEYPESPGKDWIERALTQIGTAERSTLAASVTAQRCAEQAGVSEQQATVASEMAKASADLAEAAGVTAQQASQSAQASAEQAAEAALGMFPQVRNTFAGALKGEASGTSIVLDDVSAVEHTVTVKLRSKNLIPFPYLFGGAGTSNTFNGITFTIHENGSISRVGTATSFISYNIWAAESQDALPLVDGVRYVVNKECILWYLNENGETKYAYGASVLWKAGYTAKAFYTQIESGKTVNDVIYPQLEIGASSTSQTEHTLHVPAHTEVVVICGDQTAVTTVDKGAELVSVAPDMSVSVNLTGVVMDVQYNRDIGKALQKLETAIISLGGSL